MKNIKISCCGYGFNFSKCYIKLNDKFLFLKSSPKTVYPLLWGTLRSKIRLYESPYESMVRTINNEIKIKIPEQDIIYLHSSDFKLFNIDCIDHIYGLKLKDKTEITLTDKHLAYKWMSYDEIFASSLIEGEDISIEIMYEKLQKL